ncbi:FecR domain-containing protein [Chitinophaga sp. 22321]|uniref:FecR domain-containing protein n=1 Tax=Chitinophaga hostae TaxID=2831022 RepID=A0ABS5J9Y4_9BACT|nr:FecR domain-containing protein [Chitinophaga hostae]MBS0032019.1 FecR domain-containing protein [Chitinophaga hostae]
MDSHRLDELMTAKLSGTLDEAGQRELTELLQQHPEWAQELALLEEYWNAVPAAEAPAAIVFSEMMAKAAQPAATENTRTLHWWKWAAAAAVIGLLCTLSYRLWHNVATGREIVETRNGERRQFRLSDGSIVHMNASSRLAFDLNTRSREIWLEGEAYFEVAKDAARPFVVHAATLNIHALGTAFNVKAYPGEGRCETTLLEGAVEVYLDKTPAHRVRLRPYEKVAYDNNNAIASPEKILEIKPVISKTVMAKAVALPAIDSTVSETAWVSNRLQFESLNFEQLATLLERWYGVQITFRNNNVKKYVFSGSFASETVTQALQALQLTEEFHFENNGTQIIIY